MNKFISTFLRDEEYVFLGIQPSTISSLTGFIGHAICSINEKGSKQFSFTSYNDSRADFAFMVEYRSFIKSKKLNDLLLKSTDDKFLRFDSDKYTYICHFNPDDNIPLRIFIYDRTLLARHLSTSKEGIHFIVGEYKNEFTVHDGGKIIISIPGCGDREYTVRFISKGCFMILNHKTSPQSYGVKEFSQVANRNKWNVIPK